MRQPLHRLSCLAGFLSMMICASQVKAVEASHVDVELLADTSAIQPGVPFTIGIRLRIEPEYHIYWTNPGDSGLPTRVKLNLPEGFKASEVHYPTPEKFVQAGNIVGFGYVGEVMLSAVVTAPTDFKSASGNAAKLSADVSWLACAEVCVPGKATASLDLPVGNAQPANAEMFAAWNEQLPKSLADTKDFKATFSLGDGVVNVTIEGAVPSDAVLFPPKLAGVRFDSAGVQMTPGATDVKAVLPFKRTPGQTAASHGDAVLGYTDASGQRRGLIVPIDVPAGR